MGRQGQRAAWEGSQCSEHGHITALRTFFLGRAFLGSCFSKTLDFQQSNEPVLGNRRKVILKGLGAKAREEGMVLQRGKGCRSHSSSRAGAEPAGRCWAQDKAPSLLGCPDVLSSLGKDRAAQGFPANPLGLCPPPLCGAAPP